MSPAQTRRIAGKLCPLQAVRFEGVLGGAERHRQAGPDRAEHDRGRRQRLRRRQRIVKRRRGTSAQ